MEKYMIADVQKTSEEKMQKSIEAYRLELTRIRTGRAHPDLLDHVHVDYYGNSTPLNQVGSVTVSDSRTLAIKPWDRSLIPLIEKAILQSDLGLNPATHSDVIHIPIPALTEERRRDLTKVIHHEAENAKIAIRNIRRDANAKIKQLEKDKDISEDDEHKGEELIQKLTDKYIAEVDAVLKEKETDLMTV